ncbi:MAG: transcriptional regulator [Candidatus Magasanikbacteria bacterium CG1_02_32_51]|uniref:Transcriptional regulator n=1 Tax=Candidatus Magasanikbacteria bacterium CG1_02_32_51 TaxID=1805238 RepID=A0A1J4UBP6_9BACT|nr:MAG: transcriptional regulator [Candidatus Magasanikbacteria bacterium CG1_02_32_51]
MKSYQTLKKSLLKDKEIKKVYDDLEPEFRLSQMIIAKRIEKGMSQADLAKKIGTKQPAVARLESGTYNPSVTLLKKTARALGSSLYISFE